MKTLDIGFHKIMYLLHTKRSQISQVFLNKKRERKKGFHLMNVFIWNGTQRKPPTALKHVVGVLAVVFCRVLPLHSQSITKCNGESVLFVARMGRVDVFSHSSLKMKDLYSFPYNLCNYRFVGLFYLSFIYIFSKFNIYSFIHCSVA